MTGLPSAVPVPGILSDVTANLGMSDVASYIAMCLMREDYEGARAMLRRYLAHQQATAEAVRDGKPAPAAPANEGPWPHTISKSMAQLMLVLGLLFTQVGPLVGGCWWGGGV